YKSLSQFFRHLRYKDEILIKIFKIPVLLQFLAMLIEIMINVVAQYRCGKQKFQCGRLKDCICGYNNIGCDTPATVQLTMTFLGKIYCSICQRAVGSGSIIKALVIIVGISIATLRIGTL